MLNWLTTYKRIELKPKSYDDTLESTVHHQVIPYFKGMQFFMLTHEDVYKRQVPLKCCGLWRKRWILSNPTQ